MAKEIGAAAGVSASVSTVKRSLAEGGLRSHPAAQKSLLTDANKTARLKFACEHDDWTTDDWKTATHTTKEFFTDEEKAIVRGLFATCREEC
ncbi:hypothetical protein V5799_020858 [Amblyomma americanum]|uniref:Transposase Tc1-like domain-containing protein n=1 Tax=Amblyomma americanum TaxID=6943 RepID=A0AAQ4ESU0_AMBAM